MLILAQGPPRAWGLALDASVQGILEALERDEHDSELILVSAAEKVREQAAALIDEDQIQVHAIAVTINDRKVTFATAGSCRAYLQRGSEHRRLTTASDSKGLRNAFSFVKSSETLHDNDIMVFGPSHVFGVTGVAQMARLLHDRHRVSPRALARGLLSTKEVQQTGGAVITLRVM